MIGVFDFWQPLLESTTIQKAKNYQLDKVWQHSSLVLTAFNWFLNLLTWGHALSRMRGTASFLTSLNVYIHSHAFLLTCSVKNWMIFFPFWCCHFPLLNVTSLHTNWKSDECKTKVAPSFITFLKLFITESVQLAGENFKESKHGLWGPECSLLNHFLTS